MAYDGPRRGAAARYFFKVEPASDAASGKSVLWFSWSLSLATSLILALFCVSTPQNVALTQNFDSFGFPPAGWSQQQANPASSGWKLSTATLRAWHEDEPLVVGRCNDVLLSPVFSLVGFTEAFAHVDVELVYPQFLANHPFTQGDGQTLLLFRSGGGAWETSWSECRTSPGRSSFTARVPAQFLGRSDVQLGVRYVGTYAHEVWVDLIQVDDARVAPGGAGSGNQWPNLNLPTNFLAAPFVEDFEVWNGVPPSFMAVTSLNGSTLLPDPQGWCSIAGGTVASASGVRHLEMGLQPGSTNYHNVRNSLVIGVDGSAAPGWELSFKVQDWGEESNAFDGVWISGDGVSWSYLIDGWTGYSSTWTQVSAVDLGAAGIPLNGHFYLMFAQEDNYPYANLDGIGVDDVVISTAAGGGCGLDVTAVGTCPGRSTLEILGARPGSRVMLLYGRLGSFIWSGTPCTGLALGMNRPAVGAMWDPASMVNCLPVRLPPSACGMGVQAVDLDACCAGAVTVL